MKITEKLFRIMPISLVYRLLYLRLIFLIPWRQLIRIPAISVRECDGDICIPRQRNWDVIRLR